MALSALQILGVGSLVLAGSGVLVSGIFGVNHSKINESILTNYSDECDTKMVNIYIVKNPEGSGEITKMKNKKEDYEEFFRDRPYSRGLETKIKKACKSGLMNAYLYSDNRFDWFYDENLQKYDWLNDSSVQKVNGINEF